MATRINDRLFLGSAHDAGLLLSSNPQNITAVVNVALEPDDCVSGIVNFHVPMEDADISARDFDTAFAAIREHIQSGPVLIHCMMGVSRSAVVVALFLTITEDISLAAALAQLKKLRPKVSPTPETLESAKRYLEQRHRKPKKSTSGESR